VVIPAAPAEYQISSSVCLPGAIATALCQVFDAVSVTDPTVLGGAVVSRTRITATRRSPLPVPVVGDAESELTEGDVLAAPKDETTPETALTVM